MSWAAANKNKELKHKIYDDMVAIVAKGITPLEKGKLATSLSQLYENKEHACIVVSMIYHHSIIHNERGFSLIPYKGKHIVGDKGVTFPVGDLPISLKNILSAYVYSVTC